MTLVGKIFTVLILVMSIAFMMLAVTVFATHRNWRDLVTDPNSGLQKQIADLQTTNRQLRSEVERMETQLGFEQVARRFALASLQTRLIEAEQQRDARESDFDQLLATNGNIVETLATNETNLKNITEEVSRLRDQLKEAEEDRNTKFADVVRLTDQLNTLEGRRQKLVERQVQLLEQVGRMKTVLARNDLDEFTPLDNRPPAVDGVVVKVGRRDLVEISVGSDDGIRKGHTLEVFRGYDYLGRIVIVETEPDQAVGQILPEYRKGNIKKGDRVATKFS